MAASLISISPSSSLTALRFTTSRRPCNSSGKLGNRSCNDPKLIRQIQPLKTARRSALPVTVSCCIIAQRETLQTVQRIIAKQLSVDETTVTPQTKFSDLGACSGSRNTVQIMTALEETFGISIDEGASENLSTVQDAADLVEKLKTAASGICFSSTNETLWRLYHQDYYPILKKFIVFFFEFIFA